MPTARVWRLSLCTPRDESLPSIDCISTLNPAFSISALATGAKLVSTCRSVECISTIGVPSYPASFKSSLALLKTEFNRPSIPFSVESVVPHGKYDLHAL